MDACHGRARTSRSDHAAGPPRPGRRGRGRGRTDGACGGPRGDLPRARVEEAVRVIRAEGIAALTLREVGSRLGVSRSALYRHFADKQALLTAVATEGFRTLREGLVSAWEDGGRGRAAFGAMGVAYI